MTMIFGQSRGLLAFCSTAARRFYSSGVKATIESFSDDLFARTIRIQWTDGKTGIFPYVWLRDTSPDPKTYTITPAMTARNLTMRDFDVEVSPVSVDLEDNHLVIRWPHGVLSRYESEWLRIRNPADTEARERRRKVYLRDAVLWDASQMEARLQRFSFDDIMRDDWELHEFLVSICRDGIALVTNGVGKGDVVAAIGKRIGLIHRTHFGEIFEVCTKADASNMAYASTDELPFHTDFPSLSQPPELQMLHVKQRASEGGLSLFVDGFHVAEQLRRERPEDFKLLNRVAIEYVEQGFDVHDGPSGDPERFDYDMAATHKVIHTNEKGDVTKIQFGNAMRSWFYECNVNEIQAVYRAMKAFTEICYRPQNVFAIQLQNGETVLWANTRLLHTRTAFKMSEGKSRILRGCYFSWDIVKSRIRSLRDSLQHPLNQPCV